MYPTTKKQKIWNLVASIVITAVAIVAWHFIVPLFDKVGSTVMIVSYSILLYGMTWILDAIFSFVTINSEKYDTVEKRAHMAQAIRAFAGFIFCLLYSSLSHAVVAVFFADGTRALEFATPAPEKCALALIGFSILLAGSLRAIAPSKWSGWAYAAVPVVGIILSIFVSNTIVITAMMAALTLIVSFNDAALSYKQLGTTPSTFIVWQSSYLAALSAAMIFRYFVPITFGGKIGQFLISGAINLAIAVLIDAILYGILYTRNKKELEKAAAAKQQK